MFRLLLISIFLSFFSIRCIAADLVFVHAESLSEKNIKDFQLLSDQFPGIKFLGFCHDLSVAEFDIDRNLYPDNTVVFTLFKKFGIDDFTIQSPVADEQFQNNCKRFQPRS